MFATRRVAEPQMNRHCSGDQLDERLRPGKLLDIRNDYEPPGLFKKIWQDALPEVGNMKPGNDDWFQLIHAPFCVIKSYSVGTQH